ncbi:hypothetical protein HW555_012450, partial [Spodoptera exigua]
MNLYCTEPYIILTTHARAFLSYLKGKLKGEAERLIYHLNVSSENYDTAWEILVHRYNNEQALFTHQIEIFLNQPNIQKQSSSEIKRLYDTTTECIHAIHNLGVNTNAWDPLLVHLLCKKLDTDTQTDYREARVEPRKLPKLDELMTFLEVDDEELLLTTLSINVRCSDGTYITLRALLDQGSQISLISENAVQRLGLQRRRYNASVSGIGSGASQ